MDLKGNAATWLGHGTWLWETSEGKRLLIDTWLEGNPSCPDDMKDPSALSLDGILLTHGHFDHVGQGAAEAVAAITASGAPAFAQFELAAYLGNKGCEATGFNTGGTVEVAGIQATMVQAVHSAAITDDDGRMVPSGNSNGYVLEFSDGLVVYHSGDTDVFGDMALIAEIYRPHLSVLSIGGFYTMGPRQAAHAVRLLGATQVLGSHFGTFDALAGTPAALRELVGAGVEIPDLSPGDRLG